MVFNLLLGNFALKNGGDFWWICSGLRFPRNEARKILEKFGEYSEQNSGEKFGTKIRKIRGTFALQLSWPNVLEEKKQGKPWKARVFLCRAAKILGKKRKTRKKDKGKSENKTPPQKTRKSKKKASIGRSGQKSLRGHPQSRKAYVDSRRLAAEPPRNDSGAKFPPPPSRRVKQVYTMWQIGVLIWKRCTFLAILRGLLGFQP